MPDERPGIGLKSAVLILCVDLPTTQFGGIVDELMTIEYEI
jgi:hypothetical protein